MRYGHVHHLLGSGLSILRVEGMLPNGYLAGACAHSAKGGAAGYYLHTASASAIRYAWQVIRAASITVTLRGLVVGKGEGPSAEC